MNKRIALIIAILFVFTLSACGDNGKDQTKDEKIDNEIEDVIAEDDKSDEFMEGYLKSKEREDYLAGILKEQEAFLTVNESIMSLLAEELEDNLEEYFILLDEMNVIIVRVEETEAPESFERYKINILKSMNEHEKVYHLYNDFLLTGNEDLADEIDEAFIKINLYEVEASEILQEITDKSKKEIERLSNENKK